MNIALDRRPRSRPKGTKEKEAGLLPTTPSTRTTIVPRVEIPAFTPLANVPVFTKEDIPNYESPIKSPVSVESPVSELSNKLASKSAS